MSCDRASPRPERTLHWLDLNSLVGPHQRIEDARWAVAAYRSAAGIRSGDHTVLRAGLPESEATRRWPEWHVVAHCPCVDRAEESAAWCATRYDRVVVGSGDPGFVPFVKALHVHRVEVVVVAPGGRGVT